jgi:hypothetical protein
MTGGGQFDTRHPTHDVSRGSAATRCDEGCWAGAGRGQRIPDPYVRVEAKGLEPSNLLTASQALYQLSDAPGTTRHVTSPAHPALRVSTTE